MAIETMFRLLLEIVFIAITFILCTVAVPIETNLKFENNVQGNTCFVHKQISKHIQSVFQKYMTQKELHFKWFHPGFFDALLPTCEETQIKGYRALMLGERLENTNGIECYVCCKLAKGAIPVMAKYESKVQAYIMTKCKTLPEPTKTACDNFANNEFPKIWAQYFSNVAELAAIICELSNLCPLHTKC